MALVFGGLLIVQTLISGVDVPGYASLVVVVLFLRAMNLIALGVMGEYIGKLTVENKKRPPKSTFIAFSMN